MVYLTGTASGGRKELESTDALPTASKRQALLLPIMCQKGRTIIKISYSRAVVSRTKAFSLDPIARRCLTSLQIDTNSRALDPMNRSLRSSLMIDEMIQD